MPKRLLRASQYLWLSLRTWTRRLVFWSRAIGVGAAAVLFAIGSEFTNRIYQRAVSVSPFLPLFIAPAGQAVVVTLTQKFSPGPRAAAFPRRLRRFE